MKMENKEVPQEIEQKEKFKEEKQGWKEVFWKEGEAELVGKFFGGEIENEFSLDEEKAGRIKQETDVSKDNKEVIGEVIGKAEELMEGVRVVKREKMGEKEIFEKDYEWMVSKTGEVLAKLMVKEMGKRGVWRGRDKPRFWAWGAKREKTSFAAGIREIGEFVSEEKEKEYLRRAQRVLRSLEPAEKGGPEVVMAMIGRKPQEGNKLEMGKAWRGWSHEAAHILRGLSNSFVWRKVNEELGKELGLTLVDDEVVGGFKVGSNKQGSESVGDLFGLIVHKQAEQRNRGEDKEVTIKEAIGLLGYKVRKDIDKDREKVNPRYTISRVAMLSHLKDLEKAGYGQIPALDIVALGVCGYTSVDKAPVLIGSGVIDQRALGVMRGVVRGLRDWMIEGVEDIKRD